MAVPIWAQIFARRDHTHATGGMSPATDHGALGGLSDDDHSQYHNDTRGDLRYSLIAHQNATTAPVAVHGFTNLLGLKDHQHTGAAGEGNAVVLYASLSGIPATFTPITHGSGYHTGIIGDHSNLSGLTTGDPHTQYATVAAGRAAASATWAAQAVSATVSADTVTHAALVSTFHGLTAANVPLLNAANIFTLTQTVLAATNADREILVDNDAAQGRANIRVTTRTGASFGLYGYGSGYVGTYAGVNKAALSLFYTGGPRALFSAPYGDLLFGTYATTGGTASEDMRIAGGKGYVGFKITVPLARIHAVENSATGVCILNQQGTGDIFDAQRNGTSVFKASISGGASTIGLFNVTPVVQQAHIANPTGGLTVDAESRTAITALTALVEAYGLTATS